MAEFDEEEIEYLEEDADIVQQCVQQIIPKIEDVQSPQTSLLVERSRPRPGERKKRKKEDDDSDYDPTEELIEISKKKLPPQKRTKTIHLAPSVSHDEKKYVINQPIYQHVDGTDPTVIRRRCSIRIPDYDDPLCLPVKALKLMESDKKRLNNWNNVCMEHFKHCNEILKPERGITKKSTRTAVFKNVVNKLTGAVETTIWSKTSVENVAGDKKSEIFQCVLPRYKEKKVLNNYVLSQRRRQSNRQSSVAIVSKEKHKDGEGLVVYKPKEGISAIYGMIDRRKKEGDPTERSDECKMYLKELASCRVCASCFQGSCRAASKHKNTALVCPICARTYVSVYNLLTHLKVHSDVDIRRYKKIISTMLADMVGYHYKCRICHQSFDSIKSLRQHTPQHESKEIYRCEVGNHLVNNSW